MSQPDNQPSNQPATTVGVILAGGQSSRMGQDKALLEYQDERLIDRAVGKIAAQVDHVIINRGKVIGGLQRLVHVPDATPDYQGPLAGILACLKWTLDHHDDNAVLVTAPVDSPFIPMDLVARLLDNPAPVSFAASQGRRHPVFGKWQAGLAPRLQALFDAGERKIDRAATHFGFEEVEWPLTEHPDLGPCDPFENINTPDEFEAIRNRRNTA